MVCGLGWGGVWVVVLIGFGCVVLVLGCVIGVLWNLFKMVGWRGK